MKKTHLLLIMLVFVSCKTQTKLIENARNTKDSTELVAVRGELQAVAKELQTVSSERQAVINKLSEITAQLETSENEKQNLKESFEGWKKKYDPSSGNLIEESRYTRTFEAQRELSKYQEQLRKVESELKSAIDWSEMLSVNYMSVYDEKAELVKKVEFLEEEIARNTKLETRSTKSNWWVWLMVGIAVGLFIKPIIKRIKALFL